VIADPVTLHAAAGPGGPVGSAVTHVPLAGPADPTPYSLSGGDPVLLARAAEGLPEGPARAEAIAARLDAAGASPTWGEPVRMTAAGLIDWSAALGRHAVLVLRSDPSLLAHVRAGSWWNSSARVRAARAPLLRAPAAVRRLAGLRLGADAAFWAGIRETATAAEWHRLTSGYTALIYHRIAGEMKPGQERLDLPPARFRRQVALARRLRFHPVSAAELARFHAGEATLPRRSLALTADDAFLDCVRELRRCGDRRPLLFVPTAEAGGRAHWADGEPLAGWDELRALRAAGGELGAHSRTHASLPELDDAHLRDEVAGSLEAVGPPALFAYPHGRHDARVRESARTAGAAAAFTTDVGRNGAGTDRWCLRRVGVKAWDTQPAFLWKALTGENLPGPWERRLRRRAGLPSSPAAAAPAGGPPAAAPPPRPRA
jgi:peptidoglycan/xylan/chitin deacetylase (PgdA/CDA1 family)